MAREGPPPRKALSITAPLLHLGRIDDRLPIPPGDSFTLATRYAGYANGAGTVTDLTQWELDVRGPLRLRVMIEASSEYGTPTNWSIALRTESSTPLQPLLDAFKEQELFVSSKIGALDDA